MASGPQTFVGWGVKNGTVYVHNSFLEDTQSSFLPYSSSTKISSIGKTLIISDGSGLHYFLWKDTSYQFLGSQIPRPEVDFRLGEDSYDFDHAKCDGMLNVTTVSLPNRFSYTVKSDKQLDWNNCVYGLYAKIKKERWQDKRFVGSFCVRVALELYDNSYYHISNPIFMLNHFDLHNVGLITYRAENEYSLLLFVSGQQLFFKFNQNYSDWSDIVKKVVVFVTKESDLYDTNVDAGCLFVANANIPNEHYMTTNTINTIQNLNIGDVIDFIVDMTGRDWDAHKILTPNPDNDTFKKNIESGVYYKLCELGMNGDGNWHSTADLFDTHTLENITTQEQLGADDYFSHSILKPDMLYAYNSRLNLANAQRSVFEGFDNFMPFDNNAANTYKSYVTVNTNSGVKVVSHLWTTVQKQGIYFFYPDSRATHVVITKGGNVILHRDLTEHPTLNGAYYFAGVSSTMVEPSDTGDIPSVSSDPFETLPNTLITSEVNNPFVFRAEGYNDVGVGQIIGMSTITDALSEGQFGQYPLLVFTTEGIWALAVSSTGTYTKADPISREVCNNPNSITQTDGAVFFSSDKGLMVIAGRQVKCVSEQLSGKDGSFESLTVNMGENFRAYLSDLNCSIAYDYRDSLLWIINSNIQRNNMAVCWVYNIKNGTFAKQEGQFYFVRTINHYPDTLLQDDDGNIYSLLSRPDVDHDNNTYDATLVTRPLKLENALALKSILQVRHITAFHPYPVSVEGEGTVSVDSVDTTRPSLTFKVYASNNLTSWVQLRSLRGTPWKYYRFVYTFTDLRADDHFAGSVLITQERRTNRLR